MNIKNFKNFYLNISEHPLYKDPTLKIFADTYLNSNQKSIYKLYYKYVFRVDVVRRHIKENYPWLLKKSKFSWNNPNIQDQINDWSHYYIGQMKFRETDNYYSDLFLSIKYYDSAKKIYHCTGFSVDTHDEKYNYCFEKMKTFDFFDMKYPLEIEGEIASAILKFANNTINN